MRQAEQHRGCSQRNTENLIRTLAEASGNPGDAAHAKETGRDFFNNRSPEGASYGLPQWLRKVAGERLANFWVNRRQTQLRTENSRAKYHSR